GVSLVAVLGPEDHRSRHWAQVDTVAIAPNGKRIVSGGADGLIILRDTTGNRPPLVRRASEARVITLAFDPEGQHVLSCGTDGSVQRWNANTGNNLSKFQLQIKGENVPVVTAAFGPGGWLATGVPGGGVWLWSIGDSAISRVATLDELRNPDQQK